MGNQSNAQIKEGVKTTFDNVANQYDTNLQFILSAQKMVEMVELADENPAILDLSTGTGHIAIELAKKFPNALITAVDLSDTMLDIAREKTEAEGITTITYKQQDAENLDLGDRQFDLITCGYGLFFYPNMDGVFRDVCSRLGERGQLIFSSFTTHAFEPYSQIFLEMLEKDYDIAPPSRMEERLLKSTEQIEELVGQVSFSSMDITEAPIRYPMAIEAWWKLLNSTGYQGLLSQLGDHYDRFAGEYQTHLHTLSKDGMIEFNADSWITTVRI
jgi:ubiquinone/menaquinone biosynthesis C-methylase UbiE